MLSVFLNQRRVSWQQQYSQLIHYGIVLVPFQELLEKVITKAGSLSLGMRSENTTPIIDQCE